MKNIYITLVVIFSAFYSLSQITVNQVINNANSYRNHTWTANSNNIWNSVSCGGKLVSSANWVTTGSHTALPYCWGGNSTLAAFDNSMLQGKSAGDSKTNYGYGAEPNCSAGVDCSGFVSRCYGLSTHYSTTVLNTHSLFGHRSSYTTLLVGDFVNRPGSHVRLVKQINNNGTLKLIESGSGTGNVGSSGLWKVFQWDYSVSSLINSGYNPQYYKNIGGGTPCTAPSNDNCSSATTITSNGATLTGTVKCATGSLGPNSCSGCNCTSPDDLDVYYKFVAQATSHTVTLSNYASNFDGVIELRSGCGSGTNISCYDPSGTPSTIAKAFGGLTIGQTYYVRIFEWDNSGTPPSTPTFQVKVTHTCTAPSNDNCSSATTITSNGATLTGTVKCATGSLGANTCTGCNCVSPDDLDVYYKFVAQATSHTVTLSNYASNFDGVIELRSGCGTGTNISCYDPSGTPSSVVKTFNGLTTGQTYYIRIYEWDNMGTPPSSPTFKVKVTHVCTMPSTITAGSFSGATTACSSTSQTYSVLPVTGATSYTWTLPSGWTGTSTTNSISANVGATGGEVKVKANNACGSSNLQTKQVSVNNAPATPGAISGSNTACENGSQSYSISPVSGATSYTWTLPSGWTGSSTSASINATVGSASGQVTVKANGSCGSSLDRILQVNVVNMDNTVAVNNLELTSNATGVNYQWMDCSNMQPIIGETAQVFNPTQNGNYAVIISQGNCIDTSACYQITTLGLSFADQTINLVAYPNPTSDQIVVSANGLTNEKHRIVFRNTQGQILIDQEFKVTNQTIDTEFNMSTFPSGLYFMTISTEDWKHIFKIEKL